MTDHRHGDGEILPDLLAQLPEGERIGVISGYGAYDPRGVYAASVSRQAHLVVPPPRNGKPWKRWSGYHRRSSAETAMSRLKGLGERLSGRDPARQTTEVQIRCTTLNTFNALGMPDTVARA